MRARNQKNEGQRQEELEKKEKKKKKKEKKKGAEGKPKGEKKHSVAESSSGLCKIGLGSFSLSWFQTRPLILSLVVCKSLNQRIINASKVPHSSPQAT